jgi:hypothetical protein
MRVGREPAAKDRLEQSKESRSGRYKNLGESTSSGAGRALPQLSKAIIKTSDSMAALVSMSVLRIMNMLVNVLFTFMLVHMLMLVLGMATHFFTSTYHPIVNYS